ncbi:molybdopterin-dependent oxidoreductase [Ellagibacter isourolithinifaciens]|uniref:molybdopterin-dependent oxidoreductase n=1 Tax=Ellagibacter isourolithinifaciens TaxID=2137581 RepID=UPI003AF14AB6
MAEHGVEGYNNSGVSTQLIGDFIEVPHEKPWRYQEGDLTVTRGSAWSGPGCHDGCGVLLYTDKDGKLVKVEGDPENPYNKGRLCVRCLDVPEVTYNKDRLLYPMKRDPKDRGKDKWERISWDEAIDLVADTFLDIKEKYGAEAVVFGQGTGRDIAAYITRLCWSFGSPNYVLFLSGCACYLPRVAGMAATAGSFWVADCSQQFTDRYDNPEYRIPETMFIWGNYPLRANSDGFYGHWVVDLMKRGMEVVMIDPKVTWLSAHSRLHLRVRPGCDAALALGFLNVIINEDLYDHEFVEKWTYGFDQLRERVQEYPPAKVAEITWIPEEKIVEAARILANSKPCTMQWGVAVDMTKEALPASQAIAACFQITGNVDVPGGIIAPPEILNYAGGWGRELCPEETWVKRIGLDAYPLLNFGFQIAQPDELRHTMATGEPYKIHATWLQQNNVLACMGTDPQEMYIGLMNCDFNVSVDLFMTPTIMATSDVVLPAATFPERNGLRLGDGVQRGEVINKVCSVGECKSDMEINLMLGKRFNPEAWPWEDVDEMFGAMLKAQTPYNFEEMREHGPVYLPFSYRRYETGRLRADGKPGFNTPTGRIELWSTFYNNAGMDPLPYFEEPVPGPTSTPELLDEYPLVLTTGARPWSLFHSEHRQVPRMRNLKKDNNVYLNPKTAEEYGLKNGEWVWVENVYGRCKAQVEVTNLYQDPRVIACDHAWWHPEGDAEGLYESHDLNVNNLLPGIPGRAGFGSNYKTTLVKLYKVTPEDDSNGCFPSPDSGYVSQAMDGKGVKAIEELVDERAQIMRDREAVKKAIAEAQAEQA